MSKTGELTELFLYETVDGCVGASLEIPDEQLAIMTLRNFTAQDVKEILENGNMTIVNSVLENVRSRYELQTLKG